MKHLISENTRFKLKKYLISRKAELKKLSLYTVGILYSALIYAIIFKIILDF